ncbi:hypothetical protein Fmac_027134 [Flemingia macrophylla]|uniref:Disease resistance R13L4/SHOC-2-like LRR domain-containing protein n=1 Tax=Flemingia macrophylla TaxID=520843 RepID=A0ABD1LGV3_9FABA
MQFLEKLRIHASDHQEVVDLHNVLPKFTHRKLSVNGKLEKLPNWIPELKNLVKLTLCFSFLTDDPLTSLKDMPNLLLFCMRYDAYDGKSLHFEDGGFHTLKKLRLEYLNNLKSIIIRRGALRSLERLELCVLRNLKRVSGIQYLEKLIVVKTVPREIQDKIYAYMENNSGGSSINCKIDEIGQHLYSIEYWKLSFPSEANTVIRENGQDDHNMSFGSQSQETNRGLTSTPDWLLTVTKSAVNGRPPLLWMKKGNADNA